MGKEISSVRLIDLEAVKSRVMGDMVFLREMLEEFGESISHFMPAIRNAIERHDAELLSKTVHQLKGAASNLSLIQIAAKAAELNESAKKADFITAAEVAAGLELAVDEFRDFMEKGFSDMVQGL